VIAVKHVSAGRVKQTKGLTDDPICSVEDNQARPRPMSALTNRDLGSGYRPPGSSRYSANTNKHLYAIGVVPVTYAWQDELIRKTRKAINKAMGHEDPPTRPLSRQSSRGQAHQFDHLDDKALLGMLCQILRTDSVPRCQEWLNDASEDQKDIVLNMIRVAALGEDDPTDLPSRPPSRYVWKPPPPHQSGRRYSDPLLGESFALMSLNAHPRYLFSQQNPGWGGDGGRGGGVRGGGELPKIRQNLEEKGNRKLKKSQSYNASTQIDNLVREVYKTVAPTATRKTSEQQGRDKRERRERGEKKVRVTVGGSHGSRETGYLPPLAQSRHQGTGRERSGSKDAGGRSHYGRVGGV
jgi:hypothetical protein